MLHGGWSVTSKVQIWSTVWGQYISCAPGCQTICNICRHKAICHLLATDTWRPFVLRQDTSLGSKVGQMLKCQWLLYGGL